MSAATEHIVPLVEEAVRVRSDRGETIERGELQREAGVGPDDLAAALDDLMEAGRVVEESPGEYRLPFEDELRERREPTPKPEEREPSARGDHVHREAAAALDGARAGTAVLEGTRALGSGEVALTAAMAEALSAQTLGELVKAGIAEAKNADREFVFVVTP